MNVSAQQQINFLATYFISFIRSLYSFIVILKPVYNIIDAILEADWKNISRYLNKPPRQGLLLKLQVRYIDVPF